MRVALCANLALVSTAAAGSEWCGRPLTAGAGPAASDALYVLRASLGEVTCAPAVCDLGGDGLSAADAAALLAAAVSPPATLACAADDAATCGQPVSTGAAPTAFDARLVLGASVAARRCDATVCDVDTSHTITAADAQRIGITAVGGAAALSCPAPPTTTGPPELGSPRVRPGQGACVTAIELTKCRVRARRRGPRDRLRVACLATATAGFPTGFDPSGEDLTIVVSDTDGPCFADTMPAGTCENHNLSYKCERSPTLGGLSLVRVRTRPRSPDTFRIVGKATDTDLTCLDRLSSPWAVSVSVGDDCGESGCPVLGRRVLCPSTCGNGATDAGEQCDSAGDSATCDADCTTASCGDGLLNSAAGEECDAGGPTASCSATCQSLGGSCGNATIEPGEQCDGANLGGETCTSQGFSGGSLACDAGCQLDTAGCFQCGDGNVDPGEQCDGTNLDGADCTDLGFGGGTLACTPRCALDSDGCTGTQSDLDCTITYGVTNTATLGALQFETDYSAAPGDFRGSGQSADCQVIVDVGLGFPAWNDCDTPGGCFTLPFRTLVVAITSVSGFGVPADVMECGFDASAIPTESDFAITVVDSSDPSTQPVPAVVEITDITCSGSPPSTVGPTMTTLTTPTTNTVVSGQRFAVRLHVEDAANLGALQYEVDYSAAPGDFAGSGANVACTSLVGAFSAFNDPDEGTLIGASISTTGFATPADVAECEFVIDGVVSTAPGDFSITVVDASTPDTTPVPGLTMSVSSITPLP